ncbi:VanZ family protein [Butyricicoccus sp. 1XD8-22]|nr:VanZ family protein [Butyricicoccus sp. 1XD8-22]
MNDFLIDLYECAAVLLPFGLLCLYALRTGRAPAARRRALLPLLGFYLFGVFHVTGSGTLFDALRWKLEFRPEEVNLLPFSDPNLNTVFCVLNVLLFLPLGMLVPALWGRCGSVWRILAYGCGLSLTVELSQLLNRRRTDIDDLLLNTLGALLGLLLYRLYRRIRRLPAPEPGPPVALAPALYIAVPFLCRFLLYNEWGLAKLLYGF